MINTSLKHIETPYIDAQTLLSLFSDYAKPRERILRLVKKGELIRLKSGFYLISEKIQKDGIPYEQVANLLYGPSYVSLEWALSFHGLIPEKVHSVTSITLGRRKKFETPIGQFTYLPLSAKCYSIGVTTMNSNNSIGNFLMALPEKALADLVFRDCRGMNLKNLSAELLESKRIEKQALQQMNKPLLAEIAEAYQSKRIWQLVNLIGHL